MWDHFKHKNYEYTSINWGLGTTAICITVYCVYFMKYFRGPPYGGGIWKTKDMWTYKISTLNFVLNVSQNFLSEEKSPITYLKVSDNNAMWNIHRV
jgi:hypothetical protein